jgi:hypothetical protein
MGEGLAATMVYGNGEGNTVTHAYGGAGSTPKRQGAKKKKKLAGVERSGAVAVSIKKKKKG